MAANWSANVTFTAASNTIAGSGASWIRIDPPGGPGTSGDTTMGEQALRTFVTLNAASGTAVLAFAITEIVAGTELVVYFETCAVTGDATRVTTLGNTGTAEFVARCVWQTTQRDTVDLLGHFKQGTQCYMGLTSITTATTAKLRVSSTKNAG